MKYLAEQEDYQETEDPLTKVTLKFKQLSAAKECPCAIIDLTLDLDSPTQPSTPSFKSSSLTPSQILLIINSESTIEFTLIGLSNSDILFYIDNIPINARLLNSLIKPSSWLNDESVNAYLRLLSVAFPRTFYFNSFFYQQFVNFGYDAVKSWTRKFNLFDFDSIVFPVNKSNTHWTLCAFDLRENSVSFYDSLRGSSNKFKNKVMKHLMNYLSLEQKKLKRQEITFKKVAVDVPQQADGGSCGVYMLLFAKRIGQNFSLDFTPTQANDFRKKIAFDLLIMYTEHHKIN